MAKRQTKTEQPIMDLKTETKVEKETISKLVKGNLTHLQPKDRIVRFAKRNSKQELIYDEIKATEYNVVYETIEKGVKVLKDASRFINFVAKDQELLTQKRNIDDPVEKEQYLKIIDTASFIKVAQNEFLVPIDEDENGNLIYNFDINKFDCSTIFEILNNVNEKLIDDRFSHLLQKTNGTLYVGAEKKRKVKQLIKKLSKLRFGNSFIYPKDILHIPNYEKVDINSI